MGYLNKIYDECGLEFGDECESVPLAVLDDICAFADDMPCGYPNDGGPAGDLILQAFCTAVRIERQELAALGMVDRQNTDDSGLVALQARSAFDSALAAAIEQIDVFIEALMLEKSRCMACNGTGEQRAQIVPSMYVDCHKCGGAGI